MRYANSFHANSLHSIGANSQSDYTPHHSLHQPPQNLDRKEEVEKFITTLLDTAKHLQQQSDTQDPNSLWFKSFTSLRLFTQGRLVVNEYAAAVRREGFTSS